MGHTAERRAGPGGRPQRRQSAIRHSSPEEQKTQGSARSPASEGRANAKRGKATEQQEKTEGETGGWPIQTKEKAGPVPGHTRGSGGPRATGRGRAADETGCEAGTPPEGKPPRTRQSGAGGQRKAAASTGVESKGTVKRQRAKPSPGTRRGPRAKRNGGAACKERAGRAAGGATTRSVARKAAREERGPTGEGGCAPEGSRREEDRKRQKGNGRNRSAKRTRAQESRTGENEETPGKRGKSGRGRRAMLATDAAGETVPSPMKRGRPGRLRDEQLAPAGQNGEEGVEHGVSPQCQASGPTQKCHRPRRSPWDAHAERGVPRRAARWTASSSSPASGRNSRRAPCKVRSKRRDKTARGAGQTSGGGESPAAPQEREKKTGNKRGRRRETQGIDAALHAERERPARRERKTERSGEDTKRRKERKKAEGI